MSGRAPSQAKSRWLVPAVFQLLLLAGPPACGVLAVEEGPVLDNSSAVSTRTAGTRKGLRASAAAAAAAAPDAGALAGAVGAVGAAGLLAEEPCQTAVPGQACYDAVKWAMTVGIKTYPAWYPGLSADSSFEDFQEALFRGGTGPNLNEPPRYAGCGPPCRGSPTPPPPLPATTITHTVTTTTEMPTTTVTTMPWGWHPTSNWVGGNNWCQVRVPEPGWSLESCHAGGAKMQVRVLTYNLYWWNLFRRRGGGGAPSLIANTNHNPQYDFMGFQECDDVSQVMQRAGGGVPYEFGTVEGPNSLAIAYRHTAWALLDHGAHDVAEDRRSQWFGLRSAQWIRARHKGTGKVVFFMNFHGPLPLNTGGRCGTSATAFNLLKVIALRAQPTDAIFLVGDFNANGGTPVVQQLQSRLHKVFTGPVFGGVDHIFCSCSEVVRIEDLGSGGSDHHALSAIVQV